MHYILQDDGTINVDPYFAYLNTIKEQLPPGAPSFALKREHYTLWDRETLHDAWVEFVTIREPATGERSEHRHLQIDVCLLGPHHDRRIWLTYQHVKSYTLRMPREIQQSFLDWKGQPASFFSLTNEDGHGDLYTHEVRISDKGFVIHELSFIGGSNMTIECSDILHREEFIEQT